MTKSENELLRGFLAQKCQIGDKNPCPLFANKLAEFTQGIIMPNRSREENIKLLMDSFKKAGAKGLSVDEAKETLFGNDMSKKSLTKKILEEMTYKGIIKISDKIKNRYVIVLSE